MKSNPAQLIGNPQPVFIEDGGGVSGGISQSRAIGVPIADSGPGGATVPIALDPSFAQGSPGAASGLTAAGANQDTAFVITGGEVQQFMTVVSGANGAMLGLIPVGTSEPVCNDGAVPLSLYPPPGAGFQRLAQNAATSVAVGTCAAPRRLSQTLWHQWEPPPHLSQTARCGGANCWLTATFFGALPT